MQTLTDPDEMPKYVLRGLWSAKGLVSIKIVCPYLVQHTVTSVYNDYSKTDKTKILMTNGSLMKVKSIAECSPWSIAEYSPWSILQYF